MNLSRKFRNFKNDQKGASSIIEAAFVLPFVFLVLGTLIFVGLYVLQRSTMYTLAEKIAVYEAKVAAIPGFETLYKPDAISTDMPNGITAELNTSAMQAVHDPYRYWNFFGGDYGSMESSVETFTKNNSYINIGDIDCNIDNNGIPMFNQTIAVRISATMNLPDFATTFGLEKKWGFDVTSTAVVTDTSEFIRNTNMAFDLTDFLLEKFHVKSSISKYMQRVKDIGTKWFGIGGSSTSK